MKAANKLILIGAGGAGAEALWVVRRLNEAMGNPWDCLGFADDAAALQGKTVEGLAIIGTCAEVAKRYAGQGVRFHCAIGGNRARQKAAQFFEAGGFEPATLIDPQALVAPSAQVAPGCLLAAQTIVSVRARVGRHVILNFGSMVGHDCVVGDFAQLCPGARMNGACAAGAGAFLGANAAIAPGRKLGDFAVLGASSFATGDVPAGITVLGVPARPIFTRKANRSP